MQVYGADPSSIETRETRGRERTSYERNSLEEFPLLASQQLARNNTNSTMGNNPRCIETLLKSCATLLGKRGDSRELA